MEVLARPRTPPLATIRLNGRDMGRALMSRLLSGRALADYVAPVELVERASLQAPGHARPEVFTTLTAATR